MVAAAIRPATCCASPLSLASVLSGRGSGERVLRAVAAAPEGYVAGAASRRGIADEPAGLEALSPRLGLRMSAANVAGRPASARMPSPEDLKLETT